MPSVLSGMRPLAHLYRPRTEPPGFAIPVFRDDQGALVAQEADRDGNVSGFVLCVADENHLFLPPLRSLEEGSIRQPWRVGVGMPLLFAFQRMDGSFAVGPRAEIEAVVREELLNLRAQPFTWAEGARFVGNTDQLKRAELETANLLRNPDRQKRAVAPFTAGTSLPKHRASAETLRLDEKFHVEDPLLAHLEALGWEVLRLDMHDQTSGESGRRDLSGVVLRDRLAKALLNINDVARAGPN